MTAEGRRGFRLPFWILPLLVAVAPRALLLPVSLRSESFDKYVWAAGEVAAGRGLGGRLLDFSPLYLDLHVAARRVAEDPRALLVVLQGLLGVAASLALYAAGRALGGRAAGLAAVVLYSAYPDLLALEATLEPEALALALLALLLWLGVSATRARGALAMGLALGLGVATRPNALAAGVFALVPLLAPDPERAPWRVARGRRLALFAVGVVLGALPLLAAMRRGAGGLGEAMSGGQVFHQGNSPEARGLGVAYPPLFYEMPATFTQAGDYAHEMYRGLAAADAGRALSPREADRVWRDRGLRFIGEEPGAWLRLEARKALLFFSGVEAHDVPQAVPLADAARRASPVRFGLLAALGLVGAAAAARHPRRHALPLGLLAAYVASALLLFVSTRQRLPAALPLALFAGLGLAWAARAARGRRPAALLVPALAVLFAALPRLERPLVRGYRAQFAADRRAEALAAEARTAYDAARMGEYRKRAVEASYFAPDLLDHLPALREDDVRKEVPGAELAIDAALPAAGRGEVAFLVGRYYLAAGEDHGAYETLRGAERHPWFGARAADLRARAALRLGRAGEAIQILSRTRPLSLSGEALRCVLLERSGKGEAAPARRRLVGLFGESAVAYETGRALREVGDFDGARAAFAETVRRLPRFPRARLYLAEAALRTGDDRTAAAEHEAALALDPGAHLASLRISGALARLAEAAPEDRSLRARLGRALLAEGRPEGAARVLAPLLAEDPGNDAVRRDLSRAFAEAGRLADARAVAAPLLGR